MLSCFLEGFWVVSSQAVFWLFPTLTSSSVIQVLGFGHLSMLSSNSIPVLN